MKTYPNFYSACIIMLLSTMFIPQLYSQEKEEFLSAHELIDDRIDVHAQRSLARLLKGNEVQIDAALDLNNWIKMGKLEGIYIVDQGKPALRARDIGSSWWTIIPKGQSYVIIDKPSDRVPMIALSKRIISNHEEVDKALMKAWIELLLMGLEPTNPPQPIQPGVPNNSEDTSYGSILKDLMDLMNVDPQSEEIVLQRLRGN